MSTLNEKLGNIVIGLEFGMGGVAVGEILAVLFKPSTLELFHQFPVLVVAGLIGVLSLYSGIDSLIDTNRINNKSNNPENPLWIEIDPAHR